ncbi:MAG: hypothetical protein IPO30_16190 [Hyphomonadaceae bacterium]|nr:hypothetical protein [Hyphomonadaceae bacterium]MBP9233640.1 hypothetical protein [Hyphomonadaceae bacterium]
MKLRLALVSVLALSTAACVSGNALEALKSMQILEDNPAEGISYASLSGSGGNVTLKDVTLRSTMPAIVIGEAVAEAPVQAKPEAVVKAATLTFAGLDMKNGKPVFTGMVANGVTPAGLGVDPGMTMRIGSIGIEGMNAATGAYIAGAFGKDDPGAAPPFAQWAFAKAAIKDVSIASEIPGEASPDGGAAGTPGKFKLELGEFSISNLKDTLIGLTRLAGVKGDVSIPGDFPIAGAFDFGVLDLTNIKGGLYADAFGAGAASAMPGAPPTDFSKVFAGVTSPLEYGLDGIKWSGLTSDFSGLKFDASPASYTATRDADGVVVSTSAPRATFKLTADASGGPLGALGMMVMAMAGYPSSVVEAYSQGEASFDPKKDLTRYANFNVGVTDVVDIKVEGGLLGLREALPTLLTGLLTVAGATASVASDAIAEGEESADGDADPDADADAKDGGGFAGLPSEAQGAVMSMVMGLIGLQVTDLDISITDKQLVKFILTQTASSSGQSVEAYRQDLMTMVMGSSVFLTDAGIDAALASEATTAIGAFLGEPGTLRIQIKPKTPVGAMTFMLSPPTKQSLGFSATFTPATSN